MDKNKSIAYRIGQAIGTIACIFIVAMFVTGVAILLEELAVPFKTFFYTYYKEFTIGCVVALVLFLAAAIYENK